MYIIKIEALENGAHRNESWTALPILDGYAVIPESIGTPETLENFPFGDITVEEVEGVMTVTSWTPGTMPEPLPEPEAEATTDEVLNALLGVTE